MMRTVFWILLLANALLFAAMYWGSPFFGEPVAPPQPALHEEKIRLLGAAPQSAPAAPAAPAVPAVPASQPTAAPVAASARPEARVCMEWGEFSGTDLARATSALGVLRLGNRLIRREVEYSSGYWVYIPPLKDKAAIAQKVEQLKARGVEEYFVVQEAGAWLNAISLGVFKTKEAAQNFVNELRAREVRSAQVGERNTRLKATVFVLSGLDAAAAGRLTAMQKDFPESALGEVPCALTR